MIELAALIIGTITTFLIALIVFVKNSRSITNKLFVGLAIGLVGWSVTNYLSLHTSSDGQTLFWIRWIMFFVVIQNTSFFLLVKVFPDNKSNLFQQKKYIIAVVYSLLTAATAISPFLFVGFKNGAPMPGLGMLLFIPHALIFAAGGLVNLIVEYHKSQGLKKIQFQYFLAGTLLMFTLVPFGNFILPIIFKYNQLLFLSPLYSIVFSGLIAYAIIRHRLFDIKAAVARSIAYLLSLGFIGLTYGSFIFAISSLVAFNKQASYFQRGEYVGFALLTAILFPAVKTFFARITNKIFYQDAYEPQQFLDQLNRLLVTQVDLVPLLETVTELIMNNFKTDNCAFIIRETSYFPERVIGKTAKRVTANDIQSLHDITPKIHHRVLLADNLDSEQNDLKRLMDKCDVAVLARLVTTVKYEIGGIGYLVMGPKKSGNPYNKQDENIILIIANALVIAIQNALRYEEIEEFNVTLQDKVDNATKRLQKTNDKLQALDETKDEFISMASHQLRTPLTSVKGYLSMVLEGDAGEITEMQHKLLDQAFISSQRMVYLIADLLNVSRLRTGKFIIEPVVTNLADVVEGEVRQLQDTAKSRNLTLTYNKPAEFPILMLDETKIRQVIMNFVDNAIYYTPGGGHIHIELKETDKSVEFIVTDDGIGVPADERHHLFTKFYRAGNAKKARPDGTGLGLFMCKKVIVAQGGTIIFHTQEDKGSVFGFSFEKSKLLPNPSIPKS